MVDKSQFDVSLVNFWQDIYQTFKKIGSVGDIRLFTMISGRNLMGRIVYDFRPLVWIAGNGSGSVAFCLSRQWPIYINR